jgi:L-alanine-DL-glutamate epimerase-like enolase superfamily enzyme
MLGSLMMTRRSLLGSAGAGAAFGAFEKDPPKTVPHWERPLFDLRAKIKTPVKIASIDLLERGNRHFLRTVSTDGVTGLVQCKEIGDYIPILHNKVIPSFLGKDARDIEALVDACYIKNYKVSGQAFWLPVAQVEQSLWDLMGRTAKVYTGELLGGVKRKRIPVYLSGSGRETTAEEEVRVYVEASQETNTKAVKFKIGGRMTRNADAYPGRTKKMMEMARKQLGDDCTIYVDANGSYDAKVGIEVGKWLEGLQVAFFEEPCPWEELSETKKVADALTMPVAGGEVDHSLWRYDYMIRNRVVDIIQPDLNYNGGFLQAARVARMAREHKMQIVPHSTQTAADGANIIVFASAIPNIGTHMEFPFRGSARTKKASYYTPQWKIQDGFIDVPEGPGLGVEFDPDYIKGARVVAKG